MTDSNNMSHIAHDTRCEPSVANSFPMEAALELQKSLNLARKFQRPFRPPSKPTSPKNGRNDLKR